MMEPSDVVEIGRDGAFDADAVSENALEIDAQASETLKAKGNAAFQTKAYAVAVTFYTQAIEKNPHNHVLYSNRSAAYYQLEDFTKSLADADATIALAPKWPRAFVRKAAACEALDELREALDVYKAIADMDDPAEAKKAQTKIQQLEQKLRSSKKTTGPIQKGFFHASKAKAASGIYAEKEDVVKPVVDKVSGATRLENDEERRWRYMLKRLKDGCNKDGVNPSSGQRVVLDDGVIAKLLDQHEFQSLIYPGIPKEQLAHAPKNLQELLEDPWYEEELMALMPKVQTKAHSVLTNVKKRGAAQGEIMDAATEQMLLPQVLQEAFGREVLAMVHRINYKKHVLLANDVRTIADPNADEATWDQLPDAFLNDLFGRTPHHADAVAGTAVLDGFMGDDWVPLVHSDAERMVKNDMLLDTTANGQSTGRMRFLENHDCDQSYPALAELLTKLHALPFEINAKRRDRAALCAQFAHSTALHELRDNETQRLRLDCGTGDKDNGFKLSCVYFINTCRGRQLRLRTELETDARVQTIPAKADRLVVFSSQRVFNEMVVVEPTESPLWYVAFWIHGREFR